MGILETHAQTYILDDSVEQNPGIINFKDIPLSRCVSDYISEMRHVLWHDGVKCRNCIEGRRMLE